MKSVLITGASRGIGRALALEYSSKGASVVLLARNVDALRELTHEIKARGGTAYYQRCDVADIEQMRAAVAYAKKCLGRVDLAILNAGAGAPEWMDEFSTATLRGVYDANLFGLAHGLEFLIPLMRKQGGGVIAGVSSLADARGYPGSAAYCSSKAAASTLLESARIELHPFGIRVVNVRPGFVRTDMTAKNEFYMPFLLETERAARIIRRRIAMGCSVVQFPLPVALATRFIRLLPNWLFDRMIRSSRPKRNVSL